MNSILTKGSLCPLELLPADTKRLAKTWPDGIDSYVRQLLIQQV